MDTKHSFERAQVFNFSFVLGHHYRYHAQTMDENPYNPPASGPSDTETPTHRSFRLSARSQGANGPVTVGTFHDALVFNLILQLPILLLSSMILDNSLIFKRVAIASVGFCVLMLLVGLRHRKGLPDADILIVKWGYLPVLLVTCILWAVAATFTG